MAYIYIYIHTHHCNWVQGLLGSCQEQYETGLQRRQEVDPGDGTKDMTGVRLPKIPVQGPARTGLKTGAPMA